MYRNIQLRLLLILSLTLSSMGIVLSATAAPPSNEQLISKVDNLVAKLLQEPGGVGF